MCDKYGNEFQMFYSLIILKKIPEGSQNTQSKWVKDKTIHSTQNVPQPQSIYNYRLCVGEITRKCGFVNQKIRGRRRPEHSIKHVHSKNVQLI